MDDRERTPVGPKDRTADDSSAKDKPKKKADSGSGSGGLQPGVMVTFFKDTEFREVAEQRAMKQPVLSGTSGSWPGNVPKDGFSVRMKGYIKAPFTGKHFIRMKSRADARLCIGGTWIFGSAGEFAKAPPNQRDSRVRMDAGLHLIVLEYRHSSGPVDVSLTHVVPADAEHKAKCEFVHSPDRDSK